MNTNIRPPSIKQQTLEALIRRIPEHHPGYKRAFELLSIEKAGLHGELYFDSLASKILTPQSAQLKNLTISLFKETFQIDSIILTPQFILITEIKNMIGNLHFDKKGGVLTRIMNGQREYYTCPLFQVSRHKECLTHILHTLKMSVPVYDLVIYTNQQVEFTVKESEADIYEKIHRVEQFTYQFRNMQKGARSYLTTSEINRIYKELIRKNKRPFWKDHVTKIGVYHHELLTGVVCCDCCKLAEEIRGGWKCIGCGHRASQMLHQNIIDFFLLHGPTATTEEIRTFLNLKTCRSALTYMDKLGFEFTISNNRKIFLSPIHQVSKADMEKVMK